MLRQTNRLVTAALLAAYASSHTEVFAVQLHETHKKHHSHSKHHKHSRSEDDQPHEHSLLAMKMTGDGDDQVSITAAQTLLKEMNGDGDQ